MASVSRLVEATIEALLEGVCGSDVALHNNMSVHIECLKAGLGLNGMACASVAGQRTLSDWVTAKAPLKRRRHAEETPPRESPRGSPD